MITLLFSAALAADPTPVAAPVLPAPSTRPVLTLDTDACPDVIGLHKGVSYTPACDALLVGIPRYTWQIGMVVWGDESDATRRLVQAQLLAEIAVERERADYWKDLALRPAPKRVAPGVWIGAGVVLGGAAVVLGAEAVHLVATQ